jgi:signal transduction histidine kinase
MINADSLRIEQVLINLLTNAFKYAPGKPISITLEKTGDMACIRVKDQGPGIPREAQERIFKRFERVKASDNIGGLGLGLYISHQIVEAHKGRIFVNSSENQGAEFVVELPILKHV